MTDHVSAAEVADLLRHIRILHDDHSADLVERADFYWLAATRVKRQPR
jgi:hypothetical protein